jgi:hypothetical protein
MKKLKRPKIKKITKMSNLLGDSIDDDESKLLELAENVIKDNTQKTFNFYS